jgi:hypothetical protein
MFRFKKIFTHSKSNGNKRSTIVDFSAKKTWHKNEGVTFYYSATIKGKCPPKERNGQTIFKEQKSY